MQDKVGTRKGTLAIIAPEFKKIETEVIGGIARAIARVETVEALLVMWYNLDGIWLAPGDSVILRGDVGTNKWTAANYRLKDGTQFVLCPEDQVIGYRQKAQ